VCAWFQVGSLQLHYLVVNRNSICRKWPSKTSIPRGLVEEIGCPPLKRKRGRPPKHQPCNVNRSMSSHQEINISLIDSFCGKQTPPDVIGPSKSNASLDRHVSSDVDSRPNSLSSSAKVSCRQTDKSELSFTADDALPVYNELSCEDASTDSVHAAAALSIEHRQLCSIVNGERMDSGASHAAYQPMVLIDPFVGSLFNADGLVFPSVSLDPSVQHQNLQLVSVLNVPCFIGDVGMKTEGDLAPGNMFGLANDQALNVYPDIYSCTLSQARDLSKLTTEMRPWKPELPSYWRVQHEMIEAQHYQTFTADLPLLPVIESNSDSDNFVSVLNSMTSVAISSEPGKLLAIDKGSVAGDNAEVELNSSVILANGFMPAASAMTYVAESIEVSEAISECTDVDDHSSDDVTTPHVVRHLSSVCSHQKVVGTSLNVDSSTYVESFSRPLYQDWDSLKGFTDSVNAFSSSGSPSKLKNGLVYAESSERCLVSSDLPVTLTDSCVSTPSESCMEHSTRAWELERTAVALSSSCTVKVGHCSSLEPASGNGSES